MTWRGREVAARTARIRPAGGVSPPVAILAQTASRTPTSPSRATWCSWGATTASRSGTSPTRRRPPCARRSSAPAARATCRCGATCSSCRSRMPRGRVDCGTQGVAGPASPERFRGVRIFDISNLDACARWRRCRPAAARTRTRWCRTSRPSQRLRLRLGHRRRPPGEELEGCSGGRPDEDPNTSLLPHRGDPGAAGRAAEARVVNEPRIFADPETGNPAGLWPGGDHGAGARSDGRPTSATTSPPIRARAGGGRLLRQRHPARHLGPRQPGAHRRGARPQLRLLALGHLQQRRHARSSSPTSGAAAPRRAAARPTGPSGAPTPFPVVTASCARLLLQAAGAADRRRRTAWPTTARWCRCPAATSRCRRGTRAASRSSTSPTPPTRSRSPSSTAAR
jgi:hypothetical protein